MTKLRKSGNKHHFYVYISTASINSAPTTMNDRVNNSLLILSQEQLLVQVILYELVRVKNLCRSR